MKMIEHIKKEFAKSREAIEKVNSNNLKQFKAIIKKKQAYFKKLCEFNLIFYLKTMLLHEYSSGLLNEEDEKDAFILLNKKLRKKLNIKGTEGNLNKDPFDNFGIYVEQILCNMKKETIDPNPSGDFFKIKTKEIQQININDYDNLFKMAAYSLNMAALYSMVYNDKVGTFSIGTYPALNKIDELGTIVISKSYELMGFWTAKNETRESKRRNVLKGSRVPQIKEVLRELLAKHNYTPERIASLDMRKKKIGLTKDMHELAESLGRTYRSITNRLKEIRAEERKKLKTR